MPPRPNQIPFQGELPGPGMQEPQHGFGPQGHVHGVLGGMAPGGINHLPEQPLGGLGLGQEPTLAHLLAAAAAAHQSGGLQGFPEGSRGFGGEGRRGIGGNGSLLARLRRLGEGPQMGLPEVPASVYPQMRALSPELLRAASYTQ